MPTRQTILAEAAQLVGAAAKVTGTAPLASYVDLALRDLNRISPRHVKTTLTGDGTDEYALGSGWNDRFSFIERIRWVPGNDFNSAAVWFSPEEYEVEYTSAGAAQIRFFFSPSSADRVVVEHTARHTLTDVAATTTLSDDEAGAIAHRVAALFYRALAGGTAATAPQNTDTDFIGPAIGTAGDAYRRLADDEDEAFFRLLGIAPEEAGRTAGGGPVIASVPAQPNRRNNYYLTHPRRGGGF